MNQTQTDYITNKWKRDPKSLTSFPFFFREVCEYLQLEVTDLMTNKALADAFRNLKPDQRTIREMPDTFEQIYNQLK
jgi:hypothetical protein